MSEGEREGEREQEIIKETHREDQGVEIFCQRDEHQEMNILVQEKTHANPSSFD